ncbi:MAG: cytochrome-c oxidase, cbb3-type subunit III [Pseudomonadota bacterium]
MNTKPSKHDSTDVDDHTGIGTTGHEWDGIKELNNPLPRWWLIVFYATIFWALIYCLFMPSFPGLPGLRGHSDRDNVAQEMTAAQQERAELANRLLTTASLEEIERDPELFQFAMAAGRSAFGDNCATCHGVGGRGFEGYPSLADDVWLWGGTLSDIKQTLLHGIRAENDETRTSLMPAFGEQGILTSEQITDMTTYVMNLSEPQADQEAVARAAPVFQAQCSVCHGNDGRGVRETGGPNLADAEWLYGSDRRQIRRQIYAPRHGVMPYWSDRLDDATITALAVYVHALGGGEAEQAASLPEADDLQAPRFGSLVEPQQTGVTENE